MASDDKTVILVSRNDENPDGDRHRSRGASDELALNEIRR